MSRVMSDAELRHRKKLQGNISRTTSTLGLGGVAVGAAAALASKKPGAIKHIRKVPGLKKATPEGLKDAGLYTSLASGGIGGVGGYNFAAYTNAESRKRKMTPVQKHDDGLYAGEEGSAASYLEEIRKIGEWKTIEQREQTQRRSRKTMRAAGATAGISGGLVALGYHESGDKAKYKNAGARIRHLHQHPEISGKDKLKMAGRISTRAYKGLSASGKIGVGGLAGAAAIGGAAKTGQTYQQHKVNERRRANAQRVHKSAFGVDHQTA